MFSLSLKALSTNIAFMKRATGYTAGRRSRFTPTIDTFRVSVVDGVASISFYDYETAVTVRMDARGDDAELVVSVAGLVNAIKATGSKSVASFDVVDGSLRITVDGVSVTATLIDAKGIAELPDMPVVTGEPALVVSGEDFADMAVVASTAVGTDDTLPMLTGVRLESDGGTTVDVATTDRFKLAHVKVSSASLPRSFETLLPGKSVTALGKFAAKDDCVSVTMADAEPTPSGYVPPRLVALESDNATIVVKTLDYEFPKWVRLFPDRDAVTVSFETDAQALAKRLKAMSAGAPTTKLTVDETSVTVTGLTQHDRQTVAEFTVDAGIVRCDDPIIAAFNTSYLAGILATVPKGVKVLAQFTTGSRPAVFSWSNHRVLIMPVRLSS